MYNVTFNTENKNFAEEILDCIKNLLDGSEGYSSYSMTNIPDDFDEAELFEDKCNCKCCCEDCEAQKIKGLTFGIAFDFLMQNPEFGMRLPDWEDSVVVRLQYPDEYSKMTHPYLYVESKFGRVPWKETYVEMFSDEWEIVE